MDIKTSEYSEKMILNTSGKYQPKDKLLSISSFGHEIYPARVVSFDGDRNGTNTYTIRVRVGIELIEYPVDIPNVIATDNNMIYQTNDIVDVVMGGGNLPRILKGTSSAQVGGCSGLSVGVILSQ